MKRALGLFAISVTALVAVATVTGCSGAPHGDAPGGGGAAADASTDHDAPVADYATIAALHARAISRTCTLNNGVCHNSKEYPDFHTVPNLVDAIGQGCNLNTAHHAEVHDACESQGDHLVIPSQNVDVEIATVTASPADALTVDLAAVVVKLAPGVVLTAGTAATDAVVRRGGTSFSIGAGGVAATIAADGTHVTLDLTNAAPSAKTFLDDRTYPWSEAMVRVADVNGNGVLGASLGVSLIKPGDPMKSYLVLRLIDDTQGDLMPKQCREWDGAATKALGCWVQGLKVGADGKVNNALDPIDYAACTFDPAGKGRCAASAAGGFAAVEGVVARSCGGSGCHIGEATPASGLDLSPGHARESLTQASNGVPSMKRVEPGNPEASYLWCKLEASCAARVGARMPLGVAGGLSDADLNTVKAWIIAGAN